jgi:hypothetical protein
MGKEGMGFDLSKELTDTWWTKAYSDSLSRINVSAGDGDEVDVRIRGDDEEEVDLVDNSALVKNKKKSKKVPGYTEELRPMDKMRRKMLKANFTTFSKV